MRTGDAALERRDHDIDHARLACGTLRIQNELAIVEARAGLECAPQKAGEPVGLEESVTEGAPAGLIETEREQILRGDVRIDRAQLRIEQNDSSGERIEETRRIEMRERRWEAVFKRHGTPAAG